MTDLKVGQFWMEGPRRFKILKLNKWTVEYVETNGEAVIFRGLTSRIQWEFEVEKGKLKKGGK